MEPDERSSPAAPGRWSVREALDLGERREHLAHAVTLEARSAAMDQPHFAQSLLYRGVDVFLDDRRNVARLKAMKIEHVFDLDDRNAIVVGTGGSGHGIVNLTRLGDGR